MAIAQSKFFGLLDLKFGVWLYGAFMTFFAILYLIEPQISTQDWIALLGVCTPAAALLPLQLINQDKFAYAWANWYFSFIAFILGTIYIIMETIYMVQVQSRIGPGTIRFRLNEAGNPITPSLINQDHLSDEQVDLVRNGLSALPKRYFDIQALYHDGATDFKWENGEAVVDSTSGMISLFIILDWLGYIFFVYLVLINYSHFIAAKKWTDYTTNFSTALA